MAFNPYATTDDSGETFVPEYVVPTGGSYTAPSLESGDAYTDTFGWAPNVGRTSTVDYPSAQRLGTMPRYDMRPDPAQPSDETYTRRDADEHFRHSVETIDAAPQDFAVQPGITSADRRWAPNPRSTPPPEPRITSRLSPNVYSFTRPFDTGYERQFNGTHFSMADHRREYEPVGMAPVHSARNTYRIEPTPWDTDIVDLPPQTDSVAPNGRIQSVEVPIGTRSWRLS
jgi:hypothetical protein